MLFRRTTRVPKTFEYAVNIDVIHTLDWSKIKDINTIFPTGILLTENGVRSFLVLQAADMTDPSEAGGSSSSTCARIH